MRHVRFANQETGWAVLDAAAGDGTPIALVGPLVHLEPGERARVLGEWVTDSRFGRQVKVAQASPLTPDDPDAVVAYLKRVKHIGSRRAEQLVERFGFEDLFERDRLRPRGRVRRGRTADRPRPGRRRVVAVVAGHPPAAPAAGAPRAGVSGGPDPRALRRRRARAAARQPVRADEHVRRRVRARRPDRAGGRPRADRRRTRAGGGHVRAGRVRARRLDLSADAGTAGRVRTADGRPRRRADRRLAGLRPAGGPRGRLGLPHGDGRAGGGAGGPGGGAARRAAVAAAVGGRGREPRRRRRGGDHADRAAARRR